MRLNKIKLSFLLFVLAAPLLGFWYWQSGAQARYWQGVNSNRYKALKFRYLPALSDFFQRNLGHSARTTYGLTMASPNGDNVAWSEGSLVLNWELAARFRLTFLYQRDSINPSSVEIKADLMPDFLSKLPQGELKLLVDRTNKEGNVSDVFCGQKWFSFLEKDGQINVTLRIAYPNPWIADRPEYDRGFQDEMYLRICPTVRKFLREEAFSKNEYARIELEAPHAATPGNVRRKPLATVFGFVFPEKGPPLRLMIATTTSSSKRTPDLSIRLTAEGHHLHGKHSKSFLSPEFLKLNGKDNRDYPQVSASVESGVYVNVNGDIDQFQKWAPPHDVHM